MRLVHPLHHWMYQVFTQGLASLGQAMDDLIFPWSCLLCGTEGGELHGPFCNSCRASLLNTAAMASAMSCPRCALPVGPHADVVQGCSECRGRSLGFDSALALAPYADSIRDLCLRLKHERNAWLAPWLARLLAEARQNDLTQLSPDTWIVPIPLHWRRRLQRGYNQSEALAKNLSLALNLCIRQPLSRIEATDRLAQKTAADRMNAMRLAFRVRLDPGLNGRTVLLVDDILTTGATCGAAARALKQAGAKRVIVAVLGRTL